MKLIDVRAVGRRWTGKSLPLTKLAFWQIRQAWRIFALVALGMVAEVVLVGAVPLFAQVNTTANARSAFTNTYDTSSTVQLPIVIPDSLGITQAVRQLQYDYQQQGSPFFDRPADVVLHLNQILSSQNGNVVAIHGYDIPHIASHVHVLQGRLPQTTNNGLEVALTQDNATGLDVHVGSTFTLSMSNLSLPVPVKVVGILRNLSPTAFSEPFWHGDELGPTRQNPISVVASNTNLLTLFDQLAKEVPRDALYQFVPTNTELDVYFPLDVNAITSQNSGQLQGKLDGLASREPVEFYGSLFFQNVAVDNSTLILLNTNVGNQTTIVQVPVLTLLGLMMGLLLFFVSLMTELLVTRQAEAIAITRNRGATAWQVFLPFVVQSLLLGLLTIVIAPLLIPILVRVPVLALFPPSSQNALNVLPTTPWSIIRELGWYIWTAVIIGILTICMAVWRTLSSNTLERSHTLQTTGTQRPLWQRSYADALIIMLGILTYGLYTYLAWLGAISGRLQVVLAGPCVLLAATLLSLGGALLFLRTFPRLIQWGAKVTTRGRGIVPLISLVMMARAPRQAMRTVLLLIFTIAFALFAQVFLATELPRTTELATYTTPADVSGHLAQYTTAKDTTFKQQEELYQKLPGVLSATAAFVNDENFLHTSDSASLTIVATDPSSFGNSLTWPQVDNLASIKPLLAHLADQRTTLAKLQPGQTPVALPVIVSAATKKLLHLSVGDTFFLTGINGYPRMPLVDIGEVPYLPGVPNIATDQGVLVDYDSYAPAYTAVITQGAILKPSLIWMHIKPGAAASAQVRRVLSAPTYAINTFSYRPDIMAALQQDPLYLNLVCTLVLGIGLALLLALIGCLVSTWLYVRTRLRSLLVLRALGTTPFQLALLLGWEQALIYVTAIVLGVACGAGFTALALPNVIFSSVAQLRVIATSFVNDIFQVQSTPPLQVVIPQTVWLELAVVLLLCTTGIVITVTMIARLSPAQMLRLSEDYVEEIPLFPEKKKQQIQAEVQGTGRRKGLWHETHLGRALTPVHRSWSMLGLTLLGVLLSVLFVCVVPLFSQVAATAGLHDVIVLPTNRSVTASSGSTDTILPGHVQAALAHATTVLNQTLTKHPYFHTAPIITLMDGNLSSAHALTGQKSLAFAGISEQGLAGQVRVLQGHTPQVTGAAQGKLQIMLTPQAATFLHVQVGGMLTQAGGYPLDMQVVGLFQSRTGPAAPLSTTFFYYRDPKNLASGVVTALVPLDGLAQAIDASSHTPSSNKNTAFTGVITWNYPLDETVTSNQLSDLIATLSSLALPFDNAQDIFTLSIISTPLAALQQYQQSVTVSNVPILCTSVLIIALILLFLSFMVNLLVEHEASAIALLRSRGATSSQIFAAFLKRTLVINGIGLVAGILLAIPAVTLLTRLTLQPVDQAGLTLFVSQPLQTFLSLALFALASTAVTLITMGLALYQATRADYLSLRQERARSSRKPFWQRWYLDVVGIVIAVAAYAYSLYLTNAGILDPALNVQLKAPLVLTATICLILTCTLFLLRLFPLLLRFSMRMAIRNLDTEPMLALAQMARLPRQHLRTVLLLMLTTAFVVFSVVFSASQNQHIDDVARYWAGADFSGSLHSPLTSDQASQAQKAYLHVHGVTSVVLGHTETMNDAALSTVGVSVLAVDPMSFMSTVSWPGLDISQQQTLIARLNNPLLFPDLSATWQNVAGGTIPALVDARTAQELRLTPGTAFTLGNTTFFDVAEVATIPTINDLLQAAPDNSVTTTSGILVDYQTYNIAQQQSLSQLYNFTPDGDIRALPLVDVPINSIWLKTDGSAQSLQYVRQILSSGPLHLTSFYDREVTAQALNRDPLNLNLIGILTLGALVPLLLTWVGCLMAFWMDVRRRQLFFGVLRALGSTSRQVAKGLGWEQALIFGASVILGTLFGLLAALLTLPSLVLTSVLPSLTLSGVGSFATSVQNLFSLQNAPGAHMTIPLTLAGVVALLATLAVAAVILMTRNASHIALSQTLRLNED